MNLTIKQKNPILTYPLDVVQDGHHILLTIFETEGVSYQSPYTDVNIASNKLNNAKRQSLGLSTAKSNKLMNAVAKVVGANSKINRAYDRVGASAFGSQNYKTKKRDSRTFAGQGNAKKKNFKAAISLYTPQTIKVQHKMNYEAEDLSFLGAGAAGIMEAMQGKGLGGKFRGSLEAAKQAGQRFISGLGQFAGTGGAQQAIFGSAVNRNLAEVIFTGLEYRTFSMEYSFMPKNRREAKVVDEIINILTFYALPNRKQNSAQTFDIPAEFNMRYMYFDKTNEYIHQPLTLALESIDITYGGAKFASFRGDARGAQPIRTDVNLTFRELEYADRHTLYGTGLTAEKFEKGSSDFEHADEFSSIQGSH